MGICSSVAAYDDIKIKRFKTQFEALQIKPHDVGKLLRIFRSMDVDEGGAVGLAELLAHLSLEKSNLTESVFSMFDGDDSGELNFREFVFSLWNCCTLNKTSLVYFVFNMYDDDKSGILSITEIGNMLSDIYGKKFKTDFRAKSVIAEINALSEKKVASLNLAEFCKFAKTHQALLFPAFEMQLALQHNTMGVKFWETLAKRRDALSCGQYIQVDDFVKMYLKTGLASFPRRIGQVDPRHDTSSPDELKVVRRRTTIRPVPGDSQGGKSNPKKHPLPSISYKKSSTKSPHTQIEEDDDLLLEEVITPRQLVKPPIGTPTAKSHKSLKQSSNAVSTESPSTPHSRKVYADSSSSSSSKDSHSRSHKHHDTGEKKDKNVENSNKHHHHGKHRNKDGADSPHSTPHRSPQVMSRKVLSNNNTVSLNSNRSSPTDTHFGSTDDDESLSSQYKATNNNKQASSKVHPQKNSAHH